MLRGSSRHDGIPNKQSARERDRDRLRERQRQERQQMLPNDEKDINVGAQDLFHAPVKVKPSVDDSTSAQIANTLGSFDTVRHLILDTSNRRLVNLIGVDQGSLPGTPVATRQPPQALIGGSGGHSSSTTSSSSSSAAENQGSSGSNNSSSSANKAAYFHSSLSQLSSGQQQQLSSENSSSSSSGATGNSKSHHRNLYSSSSVAGVSNNNSSSTAASNSLNSNLSASEFNFPSVASNNSASSGGNSANTFRSSSGNQLQKSHGSQSSSQSSSGGGSASGGNSNSTASNSNSGGNANSFGGHSASFANSNQVRQTASSFNSSSSNNGNSNGNNSSSSSNNNNSSNTNCSSAPTAAPASVTDVSGDGFSSANKTASNALSYGSNNCKEPLDSVSGADDKNSRHAAASKKPALERADSQLEIESMLKEMMDVTAPLTAIQTPVKETPTKKFTQRRSSKSEEKIVQSIRDSGMADVPSPVARMDSSGDSSSSYESETSDSESEDSSSGSQAGGDKLDVALPKVTPNTNSPTRWNLGAFMGPRKNDYRADANTTSTLGGSKSPKQETKPNAHQVNAINSETSPGDAPVKTDSVVSSTSLYNKTQTTIDTPPAGPPLTRKSTRSTAEAKTEPYVPPKPPPAAATTAKSSNSANNTNPVTKSLSGNNNSEDDVGKSKKETVSTRAAPASGGSGSGAGGGDNDKAASLAAGAGKRKRKRSSSSTERSSAQQAKGGAVEEKPAEHSAAAASAVAAATAAAATAAANSKSNNAANKNSPANAKNNIQDRNKKDTIRRLFLFNKKMDSPSRGDNELGKSPTSGSGSNANGSSSSSASMPPPGTSNGTTGSGDGDALEISPGGSKKTTTPSGSSNRVQAKDSGGKKSKSEGGSTSKNARNGELDPSAASATATVTEPVSKKRGDDRGSKNKDSSSSSSSSSRAAHGKKNQKSATPTQGTSSAAKSSSSSASATNASVLLPPPPPPAAKVKDEPGTSKSEKTLTLLSSSLVVKIQLNKLKRKPSHASTSMPPPPSQVMLPPPPVAIKVEKDNSTEMKVGLKTIKDPPGTSSSSSSSSSSATSVNNADLLFQKRVHYNSSRVGSSSDHSKDAKETTVVPHNPPPGRVPLDTGTSLCSDKDFRGKKRSKSKKVKPSSPKKTKTKHEPDSHSKIEEDPACGEVSSNVLGYASCDSVSVSTTRTPPVESDVVQAPDSSLNPPHLPSPVVPPQPVYFSYFEKTDHLEEYCSRDQDSYLEEAKRLKHKADGERVSTTQASVYLEAGLYFILTGISMERDRTVGSTAAFTMYKDTLVLIRYIGSRFRNRGADYSNPMEAKIIVLSMRCQSMLSYKLFRIKMRETKEMVQYLQDHFQRHPTIDLPPIVNSPQLSTPSPHSPTSSPAASSSLHPSPHHHPTQIMTTIPRNLYSNMQKTCGSAMNLISAHELWDAADTLVEKYHLEDFFIQLDRQFGPLTIHNSLVDLVRYVKHALQVLKTTELS